ncbi:hypothetical protein C8R44DRAFT_819674 [Mycena epipterygia]|nr:hypothetical protein C8R44DRAFT_819674 [Mycena epipterygia]
MNEDHVLNDLVPKRRILPILRRTSSSGPGGVLSPKTAGVVFSSAQMMVLQQKFIGRGVDGRTVSAERFKCLWNKSQCLAPAFSAPGDLLDHIEIVGTIDAHACVVSPTPKLHSHVLPSPQPPSKHPS